MVQERQKDQFVSSCNNPGKRMTQTRIVPVEEVGKDGLGDILEKTVNRIC